MYKKFLEVGHVVYEIGEWTDRHTDTPIAILRTPAGGEAITGIAYSQNN